MTDKQIIIDGIDVGGCIYYEDGKCLNGEIVQCNCKKVAVCYYKEYKRKEQECEELKEEIKKHNDDMFKNPPEKRFYCKGCTLPYISKKLKQTLIEIGEIAEGKNPAFMDNDDVVLDILQKISEVIE